MATTIDFAPFVPMVLLWTVIGASLVLTIYAFFRRARGAWSRGLALAAGIFVLANPLIVHETREPLSDIAAIVIDRSQSMGIENRTSDASKAMIEIKKRLATDKSLEVRVATVTTQTTGEDNGTQLFSALNSVLADAPPERVAGAILITDGEVHDAPKKPAIRAPLQALIVGRKDERDRKLTIVDAARFAIVDQDATVVLRVDDFGASTSGAAEVAIRVDGRDAGTRTVAVARTRRSMFPLPMAARMSSRSRRGPGRRS